MLVGSPGVFKKTASLDIYWSSFAWGQDLDLDSLGSPVLPTINSCRSAQPIVPYFLTDIVVYRQNKGEESLCPVLLGCNRALVNQECLRFQGGFLSAFSDLYGCPNPIGLNLQIKCRNWPSQASDITSPGSFLDQCEYSTLDSWGVAPASFPLNSGILVVLDTD